MREAIILIVAIATAATLAAFVTQTLRRRDRVRSRLEAASGFAPEPTFVRAANPAYHSRSWFLEPRRLGSALVYAAVAISVHVAFDVVGIALAVGVVAAVAAYFLIDTKLLRSELAVEEQLADAIDLIVSALRAGVTLIDSIDAAATEARGTLRKILDETIGRLRLGDHPPTVFSDLGRVVPLESFRLFGFILAVQWQAGGSLAATLSSVGRSIRDRLDVVRRVRAQAAEAQFSVIGILGIVYLVAALLYRADPQRIREFMQWTPGVALTIAAIVMQALGLLWMRRLSSIPL